MDLSFFNKGEKIERLIAHLQIQSKPMRMAVIFAWILFTLMIDISTGSNYTFFIFYLFPIAFSVWILDLKLAYFFILFTILLTVYVDFKMGCPIEKLLVFRWNGWTTIFMFFIAVSLLAKLKTIFSNLELIVRERTELLTHESKQRIQLQEEVLNISESERQRIACDLHDVVCQHLTAISYKTKALEIELQELNLPQAEIAAKISKRVVEAIDLTRHCAEGLFPVELFSHNLTDIIRKIIKEREKQGGLVFRCELDDTVTVQSEAALLELHHIIQEVLINVAKYAKANQVIIRLHQQEEWVRLEIEDDGIGFSKNKVQSGLGLRIMKYRANKIGALFQVNQAADSGTIVTCNWKLGL